VGLLLDFLLDVRFGSKADIPSDARDVRFTPESGHWPIDRECPLIAEAVEKVGC
jgi:hypothetical protein